MKPQTKGVPARVLLYQTYAAGSHSAGHDAVSRFGGGADPGMPGPAPCESGAFWKLLVQCKNTELYIEWIKGNGVIILYQTVYACLYGNRSQWTHHFSSDCFHFLSSVATVCGRWRAGNITKPQWPCSKSLVLGQLWTIMLHYAIGPLGSCELRECIGW